MTWRERETDVLVAGAGLGAVAAALAAADRGAPVVLAGLQDELARAGIELAWPAVQAY